LPEQGAIDIQRGGGKCSVSPASKSTPAITWLARTWMPAVDRVLARLGYRVLRLDAAPVLEQQAAALGRIREALAG
jgi:hypothetical protein